MGTVTEPASIPGPSVDVKPSESLDPPCSLETLLTMFVGRLTASQVMVIYRVAGMI